MKKFGRIYVMIVVLLVLLSIPIISLGTDQPTGQEIVLSDMTVTFTNDGIEITENGVIDPTKDMAIRVDFSVPSDGTVKSGDWVNVSLPQELKFTETKSLPIFMEVAETGQIVQLGTLEVDGSRQALLIFGDEVENEDYLDIGGYFMAGISFDEELVEGNNDVIVVRIFDKEFTIILETEEDPIHIGITKSGSADIANGMIVWTVTATPDKDTAAYDGYVFTDTLPANVTYIPDTLLINGQEPEGVVTFENGVIGYQFPDGITGEQIITYSTRIENISDLNYTNTTAKNSAVLDNDNTGDTAQAEFSVKFTPKWLAKSGRYYADSHSIVWTVTVNDSAAVLKDAVVTDTLDQALTLNGAIKVNGVEIPADGTIAPYYTFDPASRLLSVYLGDIESKQTITFTTDLDDEVRSSITNTAYLNWDAEGSSIGIDGDEASGGGTVGIGGGGSTTTTSGFISKSGGDYDYTNNEMPWSITVNQARKPIANVKIVELFVYNIDGVTKSNISSLPNLEGFTAYQGLKVATNQQFIEGSLQIDGSLAADEQYTLTEIDLGNGVHAQILEVSFGNIAETHSLSLKTKITDMEAYGVNGRNNQYSCVNYVHMVYGNNQLISNSATKKLYRHILEKDIDQGYNYIDRTITWRLHVNFNKLIISNGQITDTLPEYWDVDGEDFYEIYYGGAVTWGNNPKMAKGDQLTDTEVASLVNSVTVTDIEGTNQKKIVFDFNDMDDSYIILIKTKLSEEAAVELFMQDNQDVQVYNSAVMSGSSIVGSQGDTETTTINNKLISKTGVLASEEGSYTGDVVWTIDVNRNSINMESATDLDKAAVVDELAEYLEPKMNGEAYAVRVWQMQLSANGQWLAGEELSQDTVQSSLSYVSKVLRFELPDPNGSYRIELITVITSDTVTEINNSAYFEGLKTEQNTSSEQIRIEYAEGGAWARLAGKINVEKLDIVTKEALPEAVFQLYQLSGDEESGYTRTLKYTKQTDENGRLVFSRLTSGTYLVVELTPPPGYQLTEPNNQQIIIDTADLTRKTVDVTFENPLLTRGIQIKKVDGNNNPLAGAEFVLYKDEIADANELARTDSSLNGLVGFSNLTAGTYYIKESAAPTGYTIPENQPAVKAVIDTLGHTEYYINDVLCVEMPTLTNTANLLNIEITKTSTGGKVLAGAQFTLYDESNNVVDVVVSDKNGIARFDDLLPGDYIIRETKAPSGYRMGSTVITLSQKDFVTNGNTLYYTITNKKIVNPNDPDDPKDPDDPDEPDTPTDPYVPPTDPYVPGWPPIDINDPQIPLADGSANNNSNNSSSGGNANAAADGTIDIADGDVPLAAVPVTDDKMPQLVGCLVLLMAVLVGSIVKLSKAK